MKKALTLFSFGILIFGCKQNKTEKSNSKEVEKIVVKENVKTKDSITIIEQNKVIGDVRFGMSEAEAKEKIAEFIKNSEKIKYEESDLKYPFIGEYEFLEKGIIGLYYEDKLYYLSIDGKRIHFDKYNTELKSQLEFIKNVIKSKYGKPIINKGLPERYEINEEEIYTAYSWNIGAKNIRIDIDEVGVNYSVKLVISKPQESVKAYEKMKSEKEEYVKSVKDNF